MDYLENCPNFYWVQKYIRYTGLKRENRENGRERDTCFKI